MVRLVRTPSLHTPVAPDQWVELLEHLPDRLTRDLGGPGSNPSLICHHFSYPLQ